MGSLKLRIRVVVWFRRQLFLEGLKPEEEEKKL